MFGAIEAGGTKFVCAVSDIDLNIVDSIEIPTTSPIETMEQVKTFFSQYSIDSFGIGSFGPANIDSTSKGYGSILNTPKKLWRNFNMLSYLKERFNVPFVFNTDVNVAALGEAKFGAEDNLNNCIYVTIGTGIGVGVYKDGKMLQGLSHPEMGHFIVNRHPNDDFNGICPFHQTCLEGMASGPAIEKRWDKKAVLLKDEKEVWEIEGYYIAQALYMYILTLSPEKIILGGGVMKQRQLLPIIHTHLKKFNNGYLTFPELGEDIANYITTSNIDGKSAIMGCLYLAKEKWKQMSKG